MAHTKAKGTTKLGRDSESKRLGVKIFGGSSIKCGQIIIRQRGTKFFPGENVRRGGDDTLYATADGIVVFKKINCKRFNGNGKTRRVVSVEINQKSNVNPPAGGQNDSIKSKNFVQAKQEKMKIKSEIQEVESHKTKSQLISEEKPVGKGIPTKREEKK